MNSTDMSLLATIASENLEVAPQAHRRSFALIANGGAEHCLLESTGTIIENLIDGVGRCLGDLGLDEAPEGLHVWEGDGVWHPGSWECPEDGDMELVGEFRDLTPEECIKLSKGENIFDHSGEPSREFADLGPEDSDIPEFNVP